MQQNDLCVCLSAPLDYSTLQEGVSVLFIFVPTVYSTALSPEWGIQEMCEARMNG